MGWIVRWCSGFSGLGDNLGLVLELSLAGVASGDGLTAPMHMRGLE
jgi:hypothetical protein